MRASALTKILLKLICATGAWYPCSSMAQSDPSIDIYRPDPSIDIFQLPPSPRNLATQNGKPCKGSLKKGLQAYNDGDYSLALCHWLPAALKGDLAAQNNMGVLFENGLTIETPRSIDEAANWYVTAARQNYLPAVENLARLQMANGYTELADGWNAVALSLRQQHAVQLEAQQRQQADYGAVAGYLALCATVGCAANGGSQAPLQGPAKPPKCQISPYKKDVLGNPAIICE